MPQHAMIAVFSVELPADADIGQVAGEFPSDVQYVEGLIIPGYSADQVGELLRRGVLLPGLPKPTTDWTDMREQNVGTDPNEEVFVIRSPGGGVATLAWDECQDLIERYALNLFIDPPPPTERGTIAAFDTMQNLREALRLKFERTGERAMAELSPQLNGLEGKWVKALTPDGEWREFVVGITDGFMPHHLEIAGAAKQRRALREYERVDVKD